MTPLTVHTTGVCVSRSESNSGLGRQYPLADSIHLKLRALVYDILPSANAVFSYAIGSRKLSAYEQFFVGAQTELSLLQTTQIISDVCFITDHVAYASQIKPKSFESRWNSFFFFLPGVGAPHV